jgi:hypothetical protein
LKNEWKKKISSTVYLAASLLIFHYYTHAKQKQRRTKQNTHTPFFFFVKPKHTTWPGKKKKISKIHGIKDNKRRENPFPGKIGESCTAKKSTTESVKKTSTQERRKVHKGEEEEEEEKHKKQKKNSFVKQAPSWLVYVLPNLVQISLFIPACLKISKKINLKLKQKTKKLNYNVCILTKFDVLNSKRFLFVTIDPRTMEFYHM